MKQIDNPAININGLSKCYDGANRFALKDLSLSVNSGEVYGFLGPNGSGKSTTIRLLLNFIQPTDGSASILGNDVVKDSTAIKSSVGYMSGEVAFYGKMNGRQFLNYMNDLQPAVSKDYRASLVKRMKVDLNKKIEDLSRGNRQKIAVVQAFMHQPKIVILDEPTSGLDPLMQEEFYKLIAEAKQRGSAVFVSSHVLSEIQKICDRVGIIRAGKLIKEQNIADMISEAAQTFDITFSNKIPISGFKKIPGVKNLSTNGNVLTLHMHGKLAPLFTELAKYDVTKIDTRNLDLEEEFMRFYEDKDTKK